MMCFEMRVHVDIKLEWIGLGEGINFITIFDDLVDILIVELNILIVECGFIES